MINVPSDILKKYFLITYFFKSNDPVMLKVNKFTLFCNLDFETHNSNYYRTEVSQKQVAQREQAEYKRKIGGKYMKEGWRRQPK